MPAAGVDGLAASFSLLDRIPVEARHELADGIARIGRDILLAQKSDVAKRTGFLSTGLSLQLLVEDLRARIGLLGLGRKSKFFYGRFVEYGRHAQTVLVTRRLKRTVRGNGRSSKRRVTYEGKPYPMKVRAMAARPFVRLDRPEIRAEQRLANFWSQVLAKSGAGA